MMNFYRFKYNTLPFLLRLEVPSFIIDSLLNQSSAFGNSIPPLFARLLNKNTESNDAKEQYNTKTPLDRITSFEKEIFYCQ